MNYETNAVAVLTHSVKQRDGISLKLTLYCYKSSEEQCICSNSYYEIGFIYKQTLVLYQSQNSAYIQDVQFLICAYIGLWETLTL